MWERHGGKSGFVVRIIIASYRLLHRKYGIIMVCRPGLRSRVYTLVPLRGNHHFLPRGSQEYMLSGRSGHGL